MLPKTNRISRSVEIQQVLRRGRPVRMQTGTAHILVESLPEDVVGERLQVRFGFIVGKKVGNAVTRNYAKRRFREEAQCLLQDTALSRYMQSEPAKISHPKRINIIWRLNAAAPEVQLEVIRRDVQKVWQKACSRLVSDER